MDDAKSEFTLWHFDLIEPLLSSVLLFSFVS